MLWSKGMLRRSQEPEKGKLIRNWEKKVFSRIHRFDDLVYAISLMTAAI